MNEPEPSPLPTLAMQAAERVLTKQGLATVLAISLVWWMAHDVSGAVRNIQQKLDAHITETAFYLRSICFNTATDEGQRAGCIPPTAH